MWESVKQIIKDPFFGIVWALIGFILGHWLAIGRDKRKSFNKASAVFRESFTEEIMFLSKDRGRRPEWGSFYDGRKTAYDIISNAIKKHETAYISFRHYLSRFQRKGFDAAWRHYAEPNKTKVPSKPFIEYDSLGDFQIEKEIRQEIIDRINKLLSYSKVK